MSGTVSRLPRWPGSLPARRYEPRRRRGGHRDRKNASAERARESQGLGAPSYLTVLHDDVMSSPFPAGQYGVDVGRGHWRWLKSR